MNPMIKVVMGIITIVVALLLFPIIIDQANTLWTAAGTTYTGLQSLVAISPVVILVALMVGGGFMTWTGVGGYRKRRRIRRY